MKYQKFTNISGNTSDEVPRSITKKWIEVYDQSGKTYNTKKQVRFKTSMLRSNLRHFSDAYIVAKRIITVTDGANNNRDKKINL